MGLRWSWVGLGASWEGLGASWEGLRASWEGLGASWEGLGGPTGPLPKRKAKDERPILAFCKVGFSVFWAAAP